jgi:hypothetical protein
MTWIAYDSENLSLHLRDETAVRRQVFGVVGNKQWNKSISTVVIVGIFG